MTFDLTGLPPTPEEVQAFLADDSVNAFTRLVDRLLASPRYGEKWGRHWLDIARYADSNGLDENLVYKNAYRYRDYVINAFNKDKPYNQFVLEQLAGDLLPGTSDENAIYERQTATGFLSLGAKMLAEDDPVKMQMDIIDEQIDTMGRAFLALTVGCARCHDHKFDPIPTADYYSLAGIFKSSKTMENFKVVAKWHEYVLAPKQERDRLEAHNKRIEAQQKQISRLSRPADREISDTARRKVGAYLLAATDLLRYESMKLQSVLGDSEKADKSGLLTVRAIDFLRGNVDKNFKQDADDPRVLVDTKAAPYFVEYEVVLPEDGSYQLEIRRASPQFHTLDIRINGVLVQAGLPPEVNRTSSPDAQLWTAIGIFPFQQGRNTVRLEIDGPFPYFDQLLVAPNPLAVGAVVPKTSVQVAVDYGINPEILLQWTDYLRRSRGAPASILYAWHAFGTPAYDSLAEWTSPVARSVRWASSPRPDKNWRLSTRASSIAPTVLGGLSILKGQQMTKRKTTTRTSRTATIRTRSWLIQLWKHFDSCSMKNLGLVAPPQSRNDIIPSKREWKSTGSKKSLRLYKNLLRSSHVQWG